MKYYTCWLMFSKAQIKEAGIDDFKHLLALDLQVVKTFYKSADISYLLGLKSEFMCHISQAPFYSLCFPAWKAIYFYQY